MPKGSNVKTAPSQFNTLGTLNLFVGNSSGDTNTTGTQNTTLGYFADVSSANLQNSTAIGYQTIVNASNKVRIGNTAVTVIEGQVAFTNASDKRLKKDRVRIFDNVHVSGHGGREDARDLIKILNPEHVIPSHGDTQKLIPMIELCKEMGYKFGKNCHLMQNSQKLKI